MNENNPIPAIRNPQSTLRHSARLREWLFLFRRLFGNPLTVIGSLIILFFALLAVLAPWIAPPENPAKPYMMPHDGWRAEPSPPSLAHPFGTLPGQYDTFYGIVWGARGAFGIGLGVVAANLVVGLFLGALAGYFGGLVDEGILRMADIFYAIPFLVLAMALVVALGRGIYSIVVVLIILGWPTYTRVMRSEILVVRDSDYVLAARACGASHAWILWKHIVPNSVYSLIILASMRIGTTVLMAAALSFLGLGAEKGFADWGQMVSTGRDWIVGPPGNRLAHWHVVFIPGFTIALFVLGWNLLGDGIRDAFDPRMRRK